MGLHETIRDLYHQGTVLAGGSAGAICWFQQGHTDSNGLPLKPLDCLGWLEGSCSPHYNGEPARRPSYLQFVDDGTMIPGYAVEDGVGLHFVNEQFDRAVTWREINARITSRAKATQRWKHRSSQCGWVKMSGGIADPPRPSSVFALAGSAIPPYNFTPRPRGALCDRAAPTRGK